MKTLWNIICVTLVVNLLAIVALMMWLAQSEKLSIERVRLAMTVLFAEDNEWKQLGAPSEIDPKQTQSNIIQTVRVAGPLDSASKIDQLATLRDQEVLSRRRLETHKNILHQQLSLLESKLNADRAAFNRQVTEWGATIHAERERKSSAQFLQTIRNYEQLPPKQSKEMLLELIDKGESKTVVIYLSEMNPRASARILREFGTDAEIALATRLLEEMRMLDLTPTAAAGADRARTQSNASTLANAGPSSP